MIFSVKETFQIKDQKGEVLFTVHSGMSLTRMNMCYISEDSHIETFGYYTDRQAIDKKCFVVYLRGNYIAIPKENCDVPLTDGWKWNL